MSSLSLFASGLICYLLVCCPRWKYDVLEELQDGGLDSSVLSTARGHFRRKRWKREHNHNHHKDCEFVQQLIAQNSYMGEKMTRQNSYNMESDMSEQLRWRMTCQNSHKMEKDMSEQLLNGEGHVRTAIRWKRTCQNSYKREKDMSEQL